MLELAQNTIKIETQEKKPLGKQRTLAGCDGVGIAFFNFVICGRNIGMVKGKEKVRIVAGVQDIPNGLFSQMTDLNDKGQEQTCKKKSPELELTLL